MDRKSLLTQAFIILVLASVRPCPAQDTEFAQPLPRHGEVVERAGFPAGLRFHVVDGVGTLEFRVSTKDFSLPCYDAGTNITVLQNLHDRVSGVIDENGERLSARAVPVMVGVRGVYDADSGSVFLSRIWIPRLDGLEDCQPTEWDELDPNRGDRILERRELLPPPEETYRVEPVVQAPPVEEEPEEKEEGEEKQDPQERRDHHSGYYRPSYHSYYDYYGPPPSSEPSPAVEDSAPQSEPEPAKSTTSVRSRKTATGRAERWGQALGRFRNPGLSPAVRESLNPSQAGREGEEEEEEPEPDSGQ